MRNALCGQVKDSPHVAVAHVLQTLSIVSAAVVSTEMRGPGDEAVAYGSTCCQNSTRVSKSTVPSQVHLQILGA